MLILLVIALVVASIIALNDGSKVKSNQMAGQLETSMLDEFDLSSIAIPDISMPPLSATAGRPLSTVAQSSPNPLDTARAETVAPVVPTANTPAIVEPAAAENATTKGPAVAATAVEGTVGETIVTGKGAADQTAVKETMADVAAGSGDAVVDLASQAAPGIAVPVAPESIPALPLATLARPTEVAAPQLFSPEELPVQNGASADTRRISSLPTSNPSLSLELPQTEVIRGEGSSPTFYDGASVAGEQHTVSGSTVSGAAGGLGTPVNSSAHGPHSYGTISTASVGPVDTNMPSISTILASATARVASGDAPTAQVVTSATPDLNGESIIEAYRRFQQLHQATTSPTSNRYPDPALPP